jgi:hypothetical protein
MVLHGLLASRSVPPPQKTTNRLSESDTQNKEEVSAGTLVSSVYVDQGLLKLLIRIVQQLVVVFRLEADSLDNARILPSFCSSLFCTSI